MCIYLSVRRGHACLFVQTCCVKQLNRSKFSCRIWVSASELTVAVLPPPACHCCHPASTTGGISWHQATPPLACLLNTNPPRTCERNHRTCTHGSHCPLPLHHRQYICAGRSSSGGSGAPAPARCAAPPAPGARSVLTTHSQYAYGRDGSSAARSGHSSGWPCSACMQCCLASCNSSSARA